MSIALLMPVPWEHLADGETVCKREGKVAFGSNAFEILHKFQTEGGVGMHVLIYSSHEHQPGVPQVTWRATFLGMAKGEDYSVQDLRQYRPESCWDEDRTGPGWGCFIEVSDLERLDEEDAVTVREIPTRSGRPHAPDFIPRGPTVVTDPWE